MSNLVLPAGLPGLSWDVKKRPMFNTKVQAALSGKEVRTKLMLYPTWQYDMSYTVLRESAAQQELQKLVGFFEAHGGRFDSFLYTDPSDNAVTAQLFGLGNGSTTAFQLLRTYGAGGFIFDEPVQSVNGAPLIYRNDWQGNQLMYATPRTNSVLQSEDFSAGAWAISGLTPTVNVSNGPDGSVNTVDRLLETAATIEHYVNQGSMPYANGTTVVAGIYASPQNGRNFVRVALVQRDATTVIGAMFNVATGAIVTVDGGVTAFTPVLMPNGQYLCGIRASVGSGATAPQYRASVSNDGSTLVYLGDVTKGLNLWGAGMFDGTIITTLSSYIKTVAAAVTVTDYALGSTGLVTFATAPLAAAALTWTGSYYWRVRFDQDIMEFNNFMYQLWELKKLQLQSIKL